MLIEHTLLPEVFSITPTRYQDSRGFFFESYNQKLFPLPEYSFVQDNHSCSVKGALRGLHYQLTKPQGKLVRVISGAVLDVAVDIRKSSVNFGKHVAVELSADNCKQLWIPPGFAHGFVTLSDRAEVLYKTTEYWCKEYDRAIRYDDSDLSINWQFASNVLLSDKDNNAPFLKDAETFD